MAANTKMQIYDKVRSVPDEAKKAFNNGRFSGTDINPMWRIKTLTEQFGPAGLGWYVDNVQERCEQHGDVTMAIVNLELYFKVGDGWSKPIYGTGGNVLMRKGTVSDEGYKMAYTDALSVACKALGIGADVYFEKDTTKYTAPDPAPAPAAKRERDVEDLKFRCADCDKVITPWVVDGKVKTSIRQIAQETEKRYGRPLCLECGKKAKEAIVNGA